MPKFMYFICMCDITTSFYVNLCIYIYILCVNSYFTEGHKLDLQCVTLYKYCINKNKINKHTPKTGFSRRGPLIKVGTCRCFSVKKKDYSVITLHSFKICLVKQHHQYTETLFYFKGALAWYGKLTWESAHAWILKILCYLIVWGITLIFMVRLSFLCNVIANL